MSKIIGLTGQSGAGKTTICDIFKANGFGIIDCDKVARNVTADGSECNKILKENFTGCVDENLRLNRKKLAETVFGSKAKLKLLDDIIYPFIINYIKKKISDMCDYEYIILDAPTLFEAGADKMCSKIVSVTARREIRFERIKRRDNIPDELIEKRFSSQHDEEFFKANSDWVIENNLTPDITAERTLEIIYQIKED